MKMKEFTVGGKPRLQKAFAEVLGLFIPCGYEKGYSFIYGGHFFWDTEREYVGQSNEQSATHFDLPAQWDEAMAYARAFYGVEKAPVFCPNCIDEYFAEPKEEKPPQTIPNYVSEFVDWLYINCYEITDPGRWQRWRNGEDDEQEIVRYGPIHTTGYLYNEFLHDPGWQQPEEKPPLPESASNLPSVDEAGVIAVTYFENTTPQPSTHEQAFFVAGFQECVKWLGGQKRSEPKEEKPPLPENESDLPIIELTAVAVLEVASKEFWAFTKLYQLRQAYWNAHDGWKPDWTDGDQQKYCIQYVEEKPQICDYWFTQHFLTLPTEEQAKHFLKHHKALIEQARELL